MKTLLRFKTRNTLNAPDYERLIEFLKEHPHASIELSKPIDLELASLSPVVVAAEKFGFRIEAEILFGRPIGFEVYDQLKLDDEMQHYLAVNRRNLKLSTVVVEPENFQEDLNLILQITERTVNQICSRFGKVVELTTTTSPDLLDQHLDTMLRQEALEKRGETASPFGTIHAKSSRDAKDRAPDLVPIYVERDKAYLYEDKKVYLLLPRGFVRKLLKLEGPAMVSIDQFTDEEREVLKSFSVRKYVKTRKVGGTVYYSDLNDTTRKLLLQGMKKSQS